MIDISSFNILPFNLDNFFDWIGIDAGEYDSDIVVDHRLLDDSVLQKPKSFIRSLGQIVIGLIVGLLLILLHNILKCIKL